MLFCDFKKFDHKYFNVKTKALNNRLPFMVKQKIFRARVINMIFAVIIIAVIAVSLYKRYAPVKVPCVNLENHITIKNTVLLDIRDYNISYKNQVNGAINLPLPYLNRYVQEIPKYSIHLVVSNTIEKNMGVRFLSKRGFRVTGFSCLESEC
jgi:hypothetical protein